MRGLFGSLASIALVAVLAMACKAGARAAARQDGDLASHFATAPETAPDQQQLVRVEVNGVDSGDQLIRVSQGRITLSPATVRALGIVTRGRGETLDLSPESGIASRFDEAKAALSLTVPVSMLTAQRFAPEADATQVRLSPETWGAYVNYDLNLRHEFGGSPLGGTSTAGFGSVSGTRSSGFAGGGLVELRTLAPDSFGSFGGSVANLAMGVRRGYERPLKQMARTQE